MICWLVHRVDRFHRYCTWPPKETKIQWLLRSTLRTNPLKLSQTTTVAGYTWNIQDHTSEWKTIKTAFRMAWQDGVLYAPTIGHKQCDQQNNLLDHRFTVFNPSCLWLYHLNWSAGFSQFSRTLPLSLTPEPFVQESSNKEPLTISRVVNMFPPISTWSSAKLLLRRDLSNSPMRWPKRPNGIHPTISTITPPYEAHEWCLKYQSCKELPNWMQIDFI